MPRFTKFAFLVALLIAILLLACVSPGRAPSEGLPSFAYSSASTLGGYRIAIRIPEALDQIPCYCGCAKTSNHHSLKECFIKPDGTYDDHASGCDVCVKEAIDVDQWIGQGKSLAEVRTLIDNKYRDYGQPTDTPPVH